MFSKALVAAVAAILATGATAQYAEVANGTPNTIYFELVNAGGVIDSSSIEPGTAHEIDLGAQVSMKMDFDGSFSSPYQFEFNYGSNTGGLVYYDFSAVNGDPFVSYPRNITPWKSSCFTEACSAGDSTNDCQYTTSTNYGAHACAVTTGQATLNVVIGEGSLTKHKKRATAFTA